MLFHQVYIRLLEPTSQRSNLGKVRRFAIFLPNGTATIGADAAATDQCCAALDLCKTRSSGWQSSLCEHLGLCACGCAGTVVKSVVKKCIMS